jgi:hypothetical protein
LLAIIQHPYFLRAVVLGEKTIAHVPAQMAIATNPIVLSFHINPKHIIDAARRE